MNFIMCFDGFGVRVGGPLAARPAPSGTDLESVWFPCGWPLGAFRGPCGFVGMAVWALGVTWEAFNFFFFCLSSPLVPGLIFCTAA